MKNMKVSQLLSYALVVVISITLVAGVTEYIRIPRIKLEIEKEYSDLYNVEVWETKAVYRVKGERVPVNTRVDEDIFYKYFEEIKLPVRYLSEREISKKEIIGKYTNQDILEGEVLLQNFFKDDDIQIMVGDKREQEVRVRHLVGDTVTAGNLVDLRINYPDGTYERVLSKVRVKEIINPYTEIVMTEDGSAKEVKNMNAAKRIEYIDFIVLADLSEEESERVKVASQLGYLDATKYLSQEQLESEITFDLLKGYLLLKESNLKKGIDSNEVNRRILELSLKTTAEEINVEEAEEE